MRVIFMGTPDFSLPVLKGLTEASEYEVTAVVTQPDRARGRSGRPVFTPVKEAALAAGIPVYTPERVKEEGFLDVLRGIPCDVIVVVAFGQLLPKEVLEYPKYGCINVHASLLPRWRGAAPIQWAVLEGDKKTGVTTMQMDEGLDTGDILLKKEVEISTEETADTLFDKLSAVSSDILLQTLADAKEGNLHPKKQGEKESTYAPMLKKEMGEMDFSWDAKKLDRYVRGLNSWPCAYTGLRGKMLKVWRAGTADENTGEKPGTVVAVEKDCFMVQTGEGCLKLFEVQLAGKKRMDAGSFLRGVPIQKGEVLCL